MAAPLETLTEKEKETLRLIVRGHDAKTAARELGLSVHTINERLRAARRKLDVTNSREAARLLLEREACEADTAPETLVCEPLGDAPQLSPADNPPVTAPHSKRVLWIGGIAMLSALSLALALSLGSAPSADQTEIDARAPAVAQSDAAMEAAALEWLALVDKQDWQASYAAAGRIFREPNTVESWRSASERARIPLGAVASRKVI